ncbi:hypothetical protein, partial [Sinorhizobium meliloti]|uniref:hypothetical protein n=1 Tax=Rhizobium meliloti TaxID=382 RepID=UPI001AEC950D
EGNVFECGKAAEFLAYVLDADFHGGLDLSVPAARSDRVATRSLTRDRDMNPLDAVYRSGRKIPPSAKNLA